MEGERRKKSEQPYETNQKKKKERLWEKLITKIAWKESGYQ